MAGINRREMERNGPIRGSTGVPSPPGNFRTSAGIIDSLANPRILVALNYLNCIHRRSCNFELTGFVINVIYYNQDRYSISESGNVTREFNILKIILKLID